MEPCLSRKLLATHVEISATLPSRKGMAKFQWIRALDKLRSGQISIKLDDVIFDGLSPQLPDVDPGETQEWIDSLQGLIDVHGPSRTRYMLDRLLATAQKNSVGFPTTTSTPYINTIPSQAEPDFPGDEKIEQRIRAFVRWNAAAMVVHANSENDGIGGHLSSYASSSSLYEVGFNHFFRGKDHAEPGKHRGDLVYFQGHISPGIYARAFVEGRLTEEQLDNFRQEVSGKGLSSYPHPRLMPDFWEFPTVSMGIGPINSIYQARFNKYLHQRGLADTSDTRVWAFLGDGECDEPESLGAINVAAREGLDNLVFVINCNLQRLDGPVRGNGKIIQELESTFRGSGWNVIKVIWGRQWDELLKKDVNGVLLERLNTAVDGEFQKYATESGAYIRQHFFGTSPELLKLVEHLSDEEIRNLPRGGHDYKKLYAAYKAATEVDNGKPTVILAKTVKGWTLGPDIEARNSTHQIKKMNKAQLIALRDRLHLQDVISEESLADGHPPYCRPAVGSPEHEYLMSRRNALGGSLPKRIRKETQLPAPDPSAFSDFAQGSRGRQVSTTMAFAVMLRNMLRDANMGKYVVPIIPDEARTFGMDALFNEVGIYARFGQKYEPVDSKMTLVYREDEKGQILEEGITESGAMASFTAAGTSYSTSGIPTIPFYIFYSMFGFQRTGDLAWAFGDARGKGFMLGATAGRTTLNGEGLQHEDGHSLILGSTIPNLAVYDPAFAFETAVIVQDGIRRMYLNDEQIWYYITLYNENYVMPAMPAGAQDGIIKGLYKFASPPESAARCSRTASIIFSGSAYNAALEAQQLLAERFDCAAELWSATSYKALREEAQDVDRFNRFHTNEIPRTPYVTRALRNAIGPIVAVSDFMKMVPDQITRWVEGPFCVLGTDGYGRSDTREALRNHFETDSAHIVVAVLNELYLRNEAKPQEVADAMTLFGIKADKPNPLYQ